MQIHSNNMARVMVFNATFSYIVAVSFIGEGNQRRASDLKQQ